MDQPLRGCLGEHRAEFGDILKVEERFLAQGFDVRLEGELGIKNNSQIGD